MFEEACPYYLAMGMTYEQYWNGNPWLVVTCYKAHELRREHRNQEMWMQGLYNYQAFQTAISEFAYVLNGKKGSAPEPYLKEPFPLTKLAAEERAEKERREALETAKAKFEAWSETLVINKDGEGLGNNY